MAYAACQQAATGPVAEGSVGAGTGATVGKLFGIGQAAKMAQMAHQGLVRTIVPVHTSLDGDLVIGLGTGSAEDGIEADLNAVGLGAADAVAEAVVRAVKTATTLGGLPAWSDLRS